MNLCFLNSFPGFLFPELSPFVISLLFRSCMVLFNYFTCLLVFYCNSLRDFCFSSLRASSCLPVFSCISLRELFMSFLKSSIIIMRSDFISESCLSSVLWYPGLVIVGGIGFSWCQVTLVSVAYVLMLASHHLIISSATCPRYIWQEPVLPVILVVSELLRVQLSLWFYNSVILRSWVCQSSWKSSCLWDPEILVWPSSWDPGILWSWACQSAWEWNFLWVLWDWLRSLSPRSAQDTGPDQKASINVFKDTWMNEYFQDFDFSDSR